MMKWLSIVIMFIVFIALLAVTLGNTHSVDFNLIGLPTTKWPLVAYLWIAFVLGAMVGVMAMFGRILRLRNEAARLQREVKKLRQHNDDLSKQLSAYPQPAANAISTADVIVPVQP